MTQTYQEILRSVGYPEDVLVVDFESFYDAEYSLTKMSTIEYICDPQFECLGLGIWLPNFSSKFLYSDGDYAIKGTGLIEPDKLETFICVSTTILGKNWEKVTVVVNNAFFDIMILKEKYGIVPKYIIDVKDLAKHYDARMSHKLKDLAKMYKLPPKGDTAQFKGLHWKDFTPELKQAMCDYNRTDLIDTFELFKILLPMLTNPEIELKLARHTLDLYLNPRIRFDAEKAKELSNQMFAEMVDATRVAGHTKEELSGNKSFVALLNEALPEGEIIPMKRGKNGNIPALAKNDDGLKYLLNHFSKPVRNLVRGRQAVKSWPLHIKKIENMTAQAKVSGGLFRVPLNYYGSHTGRWSGAESVNPQNMGGKGRGKGTHKLIAAVRELLQSPLEEKFIIADSAQIEARILAWLAGQQDLIDGFATGEDIYSRFATRVFGDEVRKIRESDENPARRILEIRRGFGKDAILGCVALGTSVLTDKGWKPIEEVKEWDQIWDGKTWVLHEGVIFKGKKTCVQINGVWLTPEHEILQQGEWTTAAELNTIHQSVGINTENSQLSKSAVDNVAGLSPSNVVAPVVESLLQQGTVWSQENLHAVMCVLKRHPVKLRLIKQLCLRHTKNGCLIEFVQSLVDVRLNQLKNMVNEVSGSGPIGSQIESLFLNTWLRFQDGIIQSLKLTGLITTKDIDLVISDLLPGSKILETADILNSGRWHRFQTGGMIVSNCGFGMGSKKFYSKCLENDDLRPLFDSGEYNFDFVDSLIKTYRKVYSHIPEFWSLVEKCFKQVIKYPHEIIAIDDINTVWDKNNAHDSVKYRERLVFSNHHNNIQLQLPSGRVLYYRHCRLNNDGNIRWQWGDLWGGSITENIVQAIARDLLGYWILKLEEARLPVVLTAHDEVVCISRLPEMGLRVVKNIMKSKPDWAAGLPLDVEGVVSEKYKK